MTPEQRARAEDLAARISRQATKGESKIGRVVELYGETVALADEIAGEDRVGAMAKCALELREQQEKYRAAHAAMKATHARASILQCEMLNVPMTRGGER